jgi:hypothetical protein
MEFATSDLKDDRICAWFQFRRVKGPLYASRVTWILKNHCNGKQTLARLLNENRSNDQRIFTARRRDATIRHAVSTVFVSSIRNDIW